MKHGVRALLPLLLFTAACHGESTGPLDVGVHGRYTLRTMNGDPLPATYTEIPNYKLEFMGGIVTLKEDGTFTDSTDIRRTDGGTVRRIMDVATGEWTQVLDTVKLHSSRGERYQMTAGDRKLEQKLGGFILVYRR